MKHPIKLIIGFFSLPVLSIALTIAIIKTLIELTFVFAWQQGTHWHLSIMYKIYKFMKSKNEPKKQ